MKPAEAVLRLLDAETDPRWSEARIAVAIGTSQSTVHRIKRGQSARWEDGQAVIALAIRELSDPNPLSSELATTVSATCGEKYVRESAP